jgi:CHAD domain-containing protein
MTFQLEAQRRLGKQVRKVARKRLEKALDALRTRSRSPRSRDKAVHTARRHIREVRALLRLVRAGLGKKMFKGQNDLLRAAARPLSEVRDSVALVDAMRRLEKHFAREIKPRAFGPVVAALRERRDKTRARVLDRGRAMSKAGARLEKACRRVDKWDLGARPWGVLGPGLCDSYEIARRAMRDARKDPSDVNLHEWRKRTKDLRHQLELLELLWPDVMKAAAGQSRDLTKELGDDHDLAVLCTLLDDVTGDMPDAAAETLGALIARRRMELQRAANALGTKLYAEPAARFADRIHAYWKASRQSS